MCRKIDVLSLSALTVLLLQFAVAEPEDMQFKLASSYSSGMSNFSQATAYSARQLFKNVLEDLQTLPNPSVGMQANIKNITEFPIIVEHYEKSKFAEFISIALLGRLYHIQQYCTTPENKTPLEYELLQVSLRRNNYLTFKAEILKHFMKITNDWLKIADEFYDFLGEEVAKTHPGYKQYEDLKNEPDAEKRYDRYMRQFIWQLYTI